MLYCWYYNWWYGTKETGCNKYGSWGNIRLNGVIIKFKCLFDENNQFYLKLMKEKVKRRDNAGGLAIPNEIGYMLQFWEEKIRPLVVNDDIDAFWVNKRGNALSGWGVTQVVKKFIKNIWKDKNVGPLDIRRIVITDIIKHKICNVNGSIEDFIEDVAVALNTGVKTIYLSYNRYGDRERNVTTLNKVHEKMLSNKKGKFYC